MGVFDRKMGDFNKKNVIFFVEKMGKNGFLKWDLGATATTATQPLPQPLLDTLAPNSVNSGPIPLILGSFDSHSHSCHCHCSHCHFFLRLPHCHLATATQPQPQPLPLFRQKPMQLRQYLFYPVYIWLI